MADKSESEKRKKHKKKNKKTAKSSGEERESAAVGSGDANISPSEKPVEKQATPEQSPVPKIKMAPKAHSSNRQWSNDQDQTLLINLKQYASNLNGKQQHSQRVDWSMVEQVDDFTKFEMQEQYKTLVKKVRKTRSVMEIVEDAIALQKEEKKKKAVLAMKNKKPGKQAPNAFAIYCKAKRASLVEKHPNLNFREIYKKLCERWRELPNDKREKYVIKAEEAKMEYYKELRKFEEELVSHIKKPMTAFDLWKSERLEDDDLEGDETDNDFLVEWENLPKSTKKGWLQAAAGEKERYDLEVENMIGSNNHKVKQPGKNPKLQKPSTETKAKEEPTSDEHQQSSSSLENSLKRKQNTSAQAAKSPAKKVKKESSSSESSDSSSSDED